MKATYLSPLSLVLIILVWDECVLEKCFSLFLVQSRIISSSIKEEVFCQRDRPRVSATKREHYLTLYFLCLQSLLPDVLPHC